MNTPLASQVRLAGLVLACVLMSGCAAKYYRVTDADTGKTYYTPKVKKDKKSGAVSFVDAASGAPVTLQKPQVTQIKRAQFDQALAPKP